MVFIFLIVFFAVPLLFVFLSNPKGSSFKRAQFEQQGLISNSKINNSYPSTKQVYETLNKAGIPPCFLEVEND